ncbi:MAG: AarF/ABC1/UbiB kinase family protein [Deltaproteobacteria bacterium]|nr:AarF/ABC1/UbiB kinase family protein [Deltaproteobacteria bacterium]
MRIRKAGVIPRTYRNLDRYRQILAILFKYGFDSVLERINMASYFESGLQMISRNRRERVAALTDYERLRMAIEELGPTFIKMGQILSTRPDLIPAELARELAKLQDDVPQFPVTQVKEIVEEELHAPLDEFFTRFDETPLAAASIGQVHRAQLVTGEEVIVKVQRPGIRKTIEVDIEILYHMAALVEKHMAEGELYQPTRIVDEFARSIEREINFKIEAQHAEHFARQFTGNKSIRVPRIFKEATTERVLTMEYMDGVKASDVELLESGGFNRRIIASRGAELIFEQIFKHGFFHADPHPGNICILPGNIICFLDFGMMDYVDKRSMEIFVDIIIGYVRRDKEAITDAAMRIMEWEEHPDRRALESDIGAFIELHLYKPLKDMQIGELLRKFMELIARHRLRMPPDVYFMIKALSQAESLGRTLDPNFDMVAKAAPYIKNLQMERVNPTRLMDDIISSSGRLKHFAGEIHDLLEQLKLGKAKIRFEHRGLEPLIFGIYRSSNRIAIALIIASLVIGSSMIMAVPMAPSVVGLSLLALLGYSLAAVLGVWLLMSVWRGGKRR